MTESEKQVRVSRVPLNFGLGASFPKYAGQWQIGGNYGLYISLVKKPRWLTIWLCLIFLEWKWIDTPNV